MIYCGIPWYTMNLLNIEPSEYRAVPRLICGQSDLDRGQCFMCMEKFVLGLGSEDKVETNGRRDGRTEAIALPASINAVVKCAV